MSSGRVHSAITLLTAVAGSAYLVYTGHPASQVLPFAGGCLTGIIITPDLDVAEGSISFYWVQRIAGRFISRLWGLFWTPYSAIIPHRSPLSHFPVLGTLIRLAYMVLIYHLIWMLLHHFVNVPPLAYHAGIVIPAWGYWTFGGLALVDTLHAVMDRF